MDNLISLVMGSTPALLGLVALLGLIIGSFLNVVIHRLPIMMEREWRAHCQALDEVSREPAPAPYNLVVPGSACPHCGHAISAVENIPVLSFLLQKGRCAHCGARISRRYPLVELTSALLAVIVLWRLGPTATGAAGVVLTWGLIALTFIDIDRQLLPDALTLPLLWLGLLLNVWEVFVPLQSAVIGAAAGYLFLWTIYQLFRLMTGKEGMGYGDFKLFALFGAWLGWQQLPLIILLASAVGAVVGIAAIALRRRGRDVPIPFGPYLCAAGWIAMLWGDEIMRGYLRMARLGY